MSRDIRKSLRLSCSIPVLLRFLSGEPIEGWGIVYDLSLGGVKLETRRVLGMGEIVYLSFQLLPGFVYENVRGRAVRVTKRGFYSMVGIEFDSTVDKEHLLQGIRAMIEEEGR